MLSVTISDGRGHKRNKSDETTVIQINLPDLTTHISSVSTDGSSVADNIIPVTPLVVGEVMSKDDVFYTPHKDNPFTTKFPDATAKLLGSICDNWEAFCDFPTPSNLLTPPATPMTPEESGWGRPLHRRHSRSRSLPGSPTETRRALDHFQFDASSGHACGARRTFSAMTSIRKLEEELQHATDNSLDASFDTLSDGGSSCDSALGWDLMMKDLRTSRCPRSSRQNFARHVSVESSLLNTSLDRYRSRTEQMARYIEARLCTDPFLRRSFGGPLTWEDDFASKSYSSSESCMSLDEAAVLSPTSSFSSYTEADTEFWHSKTQMEVMEYRRRSRERFQELIRRWETKQSSDGKGPSTSSEHRSQQLPESRQSNLYERTEYSDFYLERRFEELRKKWEMTQIAVEARPTGSHRIGTIPKSFSSSLLTRSTKKSS